jgi:hypothetical protein
MVLDYQLIVKILNQLISMSPKHFLKEIEMGRIAGPFNERPFTNWRLSPIGVVRKNLHPQVGGLYSIFLFLLVRV